MKSNKQKKWAVSLLSVFLCFSLWQVDQDSHVQLVLEDKSGQVLYAFDDMPEYIAYEFTHSVNQGEIREVYRLDYTSRTMVLVDCYFNNYGAGMLDTVSGDNLFSLTPNGYKITYNDTPEQQAINFAAAGVAGGKLVAGREQVDIFALKPYQTITLTFAKGMPKGE